MKILFVCLGNICRSPIAEGVLKKLVRERDLPWTIASAGTNRWHKGGPADPRAIQAALHQGVDLSGHIARRFQVQDFEMYDRIFSMADDVYSEIQSFAQHPDQMKKVENFLDVLGEEPGRSVPDPWYHGEEAFEDCYDLIEKACLCLIEESATLSASHSS